MITRAVGPEVLEDGSQRCGRHGYLKEVVTKWDLGKEC